MTQRTSAILPVHLYGQMADMVGLARLADESQLVLIEDACQAHGARRDELDAGTVGGASAFSFYPAKNLGAFGDAGALVTGTRSVAAAARRLRTHGQAHKNHHAEIGYTARLDSIQAIVLLHKLPMAREATALRAAAAARYTAELAGVGDLVTPPAVPGSDPAWHLYVVRTPQRGELAQALADAEIGVGVHYPTPPHLTPAYAHLGYPRGSFPVAERLSDEVLSLPMFPGITEAQIDLVVGAIKRFYDA